MLVMLEQRFTASNDVDQLMIGTIFLELEEELGAYVEYRFVCVCLCLLVFVYVCFEFFFCFFFLV